MGLPPTRAVLVLAFAVLSVSALPAPRAIARGQLSISCPSSFVVGNDAGRCGANVKYPNPTVTGGFSPTVSCSPTSGSFFPTGSTTVTCIATDSYTETTVQCSFTVTVRDTEPPKLSCPPAVTVNTGLNQCVATNVSLGAPTVSDNCGIASVSNNAPGTYSRGIAVVTWTVIDTSGNRATCQQTVMVRDAQPPAIQCPADIARNSDPGQNSARVALETPTASDNCPGVTVAGTRSDQLSMNGPYPIGTTIVLWTATDTSGNQTTCTQRVTIQASNQAPTIRIQQGSKVGDPVAANARLELFGDDPSAPDSAVTTVTGAGDDGSLTLLDYAGTALLRAPPQGGPAQILLDTTRQNVPGGVGLARLQQIKSSRSGVHAIQALRADNSRAIFRLDQGLPALLAVLPEGRGLAELTISDAGQIAYIAPVDAGPGSPLGLFLALRGQQPRALFTVGSVTTSGLTVTGIHDLQVNSAGVLTYILDLRSASGAVLQAVLRGTSTEHVGVAVTGRAAPGLPGLLTAVRKPRIGPDGTIVFQGSGAPPQSGGPGFVNFFADGPGRTLAPLLRADNWSTADGSFDYDVAASGAIAIRATLATTNDSELYLVSPTGSVDTVVSGRPDIQPAGHPAFGPDNRLFFLGQNMQLPLGRNNLRETGLYRSRRVGNQLVLDGVAVPDQPVPGWTGVRLLSITQRPVVTANDLIFGVLFGGPESLPVPTADLFRVSLDQTLASGREVILEGNPETNANLLAMLRDLTYQGNQGLVFYGLLPGAGPVVAPSTAPITIASLFRTQALAAGVPINPLVATGDNLLGAGQLEHALPPLLSLGADRELFVARTSQIASRQGDNEGLFTVRPGKLVDQAGVSRSPVPGLANTTFNGFADIQRFVQPFGPPSIGEDGRVVFKALLNVNNQPQGGIFVWAPGGQPTLIQGPQNPELLLGWAAGKTGVNSVLEQSSGSAAQLLMGRGTSLQPVVTIGVTPEMLQVRPEGGVFLVTNAGGELFVVGVGPSGPGVYRLNGTGLAPLVTQDSLVPQDGPGRGFRFAGDFELDPDSPHGNLIFRAAVQQSGGPRLKGDFELASTGLFTRAIGSTDETSARTLRVDVLPSNLPVQSRNGVVVSARFDSATSSWSLVRFQGQKMDVIAQDQKGDRNSRFAALDAGALLQFDIDLRVRRGPVFTISDAGDIAFLASDGQSWGVYQAPAQSSAR